MTEGCLTQDILTSVNKHKAYRPTPFVKKQSWQEAFDLQAKDTTAYVLNMRSS